METAIKSVEDVGVLYIGQLKERQMSKKIINAYTFLIKQQLLSLSDVPEKYHTQELMEIDEELNGGANGWKISNYLAAHKTGER